MISKDKIDGFDAEFEVVSCFCEKEDKHLLLQRADTVFMPRRWGPPAGKVEKGEDLQEALKREVFEETGFDIADNEICYIDKYYVTHGGKKFVYHVYKTLVPEARVVLSSREHRDYKWVTPTEALLLPLIHDQDTVVRDCYNI